MRIFVWIQLSVWLCLFSLALPNNALSQNRVSLLKIVEIDRSGDELNHSEARSTISIDIHSQLWITPQQDSISKLVGRDPISAVNDTNGKIIESRAKLLTTISLCDTLVRIAKETVKLSLDRKIGDQSQIIIINVNTKKFARTETQRDNALRDYLSIIGHTNKETEEILDDVYPTDGDYSKLRAFVQQELQRIDAEIEKETKGVYSHASNARMKLAAQLLQNNQTNPIHLPSYDTKSNDYHTPIPKISFQLTDKQKGELKEKQEYYDKLANIVRDMQTNQNGLKGFLDDQKNKLQKILDSVRNTALFAADFFKDAYRDDLKNNAEKVYAKNKDFIKNYNNFVDLLKVTRDSAKTMRDTVNSIVKSFFPAASSSAPQDYLECVLDHVNALNFIIKQSPKLIVSINNTLEASKIVYMAVSKPEGIDTTSMEFKQIQEAAQYFQSIDIKKNIVDLLNSNISELATYIESFIKIKPSVTNAIGLKTFDGLLFKDGSYISKSLTELVPTNINISTIGADEGSVIRLTIQIYDAQDENKVLYEQDQFFEIRKFGISSAVTAGLVFVNAIDPAYSGKAHNVPTVSASYLFRIRPCRIEYDYLSVGFHAVTLDFDSAVPIEIGMGFSLHFFNDILQTGYGWNLHAPGSPTYWYVGLGILDLLNSANKLTF